MASDASQMQAAGQSRYGNWIVITGIMLLFGISVAATQFKVPVIMTSLMDQFGMDAGAASWLMSIVTLVGVIAALPFGSLAQRYGGKRVLLAAVVVLAVGSLLGVIFPVVPMLLVSRALEGVMVVAVGVCGSVTLQTYVNPAHIGTANGAWALWVSVGQIISGVTMPSFFSLGGFAVAWLFYTLCTVVIAFAVWRFVRYRNVPASEPAQQLELHGRDRVSPLQADDELAQPANAPETNSSSQLLVSELSEDTAGTTRITDLLKPRYLMYLFTFMIFNIVMISLVTYSPVSMQFQGMDQTLSGFISTLPMLISIFSCPLAGALVDRTGKVKPIYLTGMFFIGPSAMLMIMGSSPLLFVGAVLFGVVGMAVPAVCLTAYRILLGTPERLAVGIGLLLVLQSVGQFLGTFLAPIFLGPAGDNFFALGVYVCIIGLVGAVVTIFTKFK